MRKTGKIVAIMHPIAYIYSNYRKTSDIPRGLGAQHSAEGIIEVLPQFEKGLKDIEGFSHLIIVWFFHKVKGFSLSAKPPSDNKMHGVFATRSPQRPNPIGLTAVQLLRREGRLLHVRGIDMLNGTPVLDIKPYLSSIPPEQLKRGWLEEAEKRRRNRA
jgi:tRNA-Thr(GGU) m(6)t(6)A37 methyltransferase TsaA